MLRIIFSFCLCLITSYAVADTSAVVIGYANNDAFWSYPKIQQYLDGARNAKISIKHYQSGCELLAAMKAGEVDLAYADVPMLYQVQLQSLPYEPVATEVTRAQNNQGRVTYTSLLVTSTASSIVSVRGVAGKTVGIVPWTLSGEAIPELLLQQVGLLPAQGKSTISRYKQVVFNSFDDAKQALADGTVDVVGYPSLYKLDPQKYGVIAALKDIPNPALVGASDRLSSAAMQESIALLKTIPTQSQYPGLGNTMRFASVQSTPYVYWAKQLSQSGLFSNDSCETSAESSQVNTEDNPVPDDAQATQEGQQEPLEEQPKDNSDPSMDDSLSSSVQQ